MRFGLSFPHYGFSFPDGGPLTWERTLAHARRAEELGFDSLWISDHFFLSLTRYGGPPDPEGSLEPFTTLAALATATSRIRLGTLVACSEFRHPSHVAKMSSTIDLLSGGRFELGLGAGWYEDEFDAFGYGFPPASERFSVLEATVTVVAALLHEEGPITLDAPPFHLDRAYNRPPPARPGGTLIWIGAKGGPRALQLIARHRVGWNTVWKWTLEDYAATARRLDEACERAGRDPREIPRSLGLYTLIGEDARDLAARFEALRRWSPGGALDGVTLESYREGRLVGTPDEVRGQIDRWKAVGVEELIVAPASLPFAVADDSMLDLFAETVIVHSA